MSKLLKPELFLAAALALSGALATAQPTPSAPRVRRRTSLARSPGARDKPLHYEDKTSVEAQAPPVPLPSDSVTKLETNVLDLPLSLSVVSGRLAAEQAGFVLGDALKNASGVNVATGYGLFDFFVVRGFDSLDTGLVLVDGAPDLEAPFYPLYNVQQVDVLKGPGAFAWGGGALGSAVQVVRKQPVAARFADVTLSYGRYGTYEAAGDANLASADGKRGVPSERRRPGHERLPRRPRRDARRAQPELPVAPGRAHAARAVVRVPEQRPVAGLRVALPRRLARRPLAPDLVPVGERFLDAARPPGAARRRAAA